MELTITAAATRIDRVYEKDWLSISKKPIRKYCDKRRRRRSEKMDDKRKEKCVF
jgi:hypothetical protein